MTAHSLLPRLLPGLFFLTLTVLCYLLHFNGLYGQDAHEYLRQSRVIFDRWQGMAAPVPGIGDAEFAGVYPLAGALMRLITGNPILALQCVSWLAAALGLLVFERLLGMLAPGSRIESRWIYTGLGLLLAPMFFRAGVTSMSDGLGLLLALTAFFFGLRALENRKITDAVWAMAFAALAISTRYALAALVLPLAGSLFYYLWTRKKWLVILCAILSGVVAFLPHFWLKMNGTENPFGHSMLQHWSPGNFFQRSFSNENGLSRYPLPNILFLFFPFGHPAFCLLLPGLFLLSKKTDLLLPAKKILLACIATYLILLGGLPHQNLRHLLPAYALLLLLLFPAWDRLYCYGFVFFRRLTMSILVTALAVQIFCCAFYFAPTLSRNKLERDIAHHLENTLPPNAIVYAFDLDIALRNYLPEVQFRNLWERRYTEFPSGSFVLFKEALYPQWQGQNPVLNWDHLREHYSPERKAVFSDGWELWEIR